ncbi:DUF4097 family beta strand repeat protein [bacterium]|nr:DUF4097 family beta strand repeat protein [bacterium]
MKRIRIIHSLIPVLLVAVTAANAQALEKKNDYWQLKTEKNFPVKSGGTLKLEEISGDVEIDVWEKNEVQIRAIYHFNVITRDEAEALSKNFEVEYRNSDNRVTISAPEVHKQSVYVDYEILLPKKFNCDIEVQGGDLSIQNVDGSVNGKVGGGDVELSGLTGPLNIDVGGGDVEIDGCRKDIDLNLGGGDLEIHNAGGAMTMNVGGGDVEIKDSEGPVTLNLGGGDLEISGLGKNVDLKVGGGDVELKEIKGGLTCQLGGGSTSLKDIYGAVKVQNGGGDIEMALSSRVSVKSPITLETGMGDIELSLPADVKASLRVEVKKMSGYSDEEIDSDFPLNVSSSEKSSNTVIAEAELNGGGAQILLKTKGGSVSIEKDND